MAYPIVPGKQLFLDAEWALSSIAVDSEAKRREE